ncbi:MAG: M23 family metallopeptidase [Bdellovibrionales bacterium]|nr:M23 family metallopeptidase [Bdellovibrionales bacterium]
MAKIFLCLVFLVTFSSSIFASEKAFTILIKQGFKPEDLVSLVALAPELKDFDVTTDSTEIVHSERAFISVKIYSDKNNDAYQITKSGNVINVEKLAAIFEVEVKVIEGSVQNNLYDSIFHELKSIEIAQIIEDTFKDEFTTSKGLKSKPLYRFQIEQYFEDGKFVRYGHVLNVSLIIGQAMTSRSYRMDTENFSWGLFPENSGNVDRPFYRPVESERVTSPFQLNRRHPVTKKHQPHKGIDLRAPNGSPIFPALEGEVVVISRSRSKGKYITLLHDNGYQTTYIHLKNYAPGLKVGQWVDLDEKIGEVGRTGYSTGAHLHFGVIQNGYFVNPIYLLKKYTYKNRNNHPDDELSIEEKGPISDELLEEESEEAPAGIE